MRISWKRSLGEAFVSVQLYIHLFVKHALIWVEVKQYNINLYIYL